MSQRNPLNRFRKQDDSETSEPVSTSTSQHVNGQTEPQANVPTSQQGSTATSKQADVPTGKLEKPTKSYRLHRSLTQRFMLWAKSRNMTESEAVERAMLLLMSQDDPQRKALLAELAAIGQQLEEGE